MSSKLLYKLLPCEEEALKFLERNKIQDAKLIRTDPDWILFTQEGAEGKRYAWTAWTEGKDPSRTMLRLDEGFVAEYE